MQARPYILAETNWKTVKETDYQVAILPWGACEAHNYHLPYSTDNYEAFGIASEAAKIAWDKGAKVIVLPTIPLGINTGQLDVKLCMNINPDTQYAILKDIADVLIRHGIFKLVIINSHGGNHFKNMIRSLSFDFPELFCCATDWWKSVDMQDFFDEPGDHAGEMETSLLLHLHPQLVRPLHEAGSGKAKVYKIKGLKEGWVTAQRQWTKVTEDTGVGNPAAATPEKGKAFLEAAAKEIGGFLVELEKTALDDFYE